MIGLIFTRILCIIDISLFRFIPVLLPEVLLPCPGLQLA